MHHLTLWSACILFIATVALSAACERRPRSRNPAIQQTPGPVYVFFDGSEPVPPSQWAEVAPSAGSGDAEALLAHLHIREVVRKFNQFASEATLDPALDPSPHFIEDVPTIKALGELDRMPLKWDEDGDQFRLPDGRQLHAMDLGAYFSAIRHVLRKGDGLQSYYVDTDIGNSILSIGYHLYRSESAARSARSRIILLGSVWDTAFSIHETRARADGRAAEADLWKTRREELIKASRHMLATELDSRR